jgi:triacylglycerol lipase
MRTLQAVLVVVAVSAVGLPGSARAGAARTTYPVVFAHGAGGFDNILGYDYWGDDYGVFVGDPCDGFLEVSCNGDIDSGQRAYVAQVAPLQSSEVRGLDLANDVEGFMATAGTAYVNLVGHSQGGIDARKAARVLAQRRGYPVVRVLVSVSSPHRGSPVAKYILDLKPGVTSVIAALATIYGDVVYGPGNDAFAAAKQLVYGDYDAADGRTTGMRAFNLSYPVSSSYAARYASFVTAQNGLNVNPALFLLSKGFYDIDGDGACAEDGDNDGAGGCGDGYRNEQDDDGLVGINSQQMGYRLRYSEVFLGLDQVSTDGNLGYVGNLNAPSSLQQTSLSSVVSQDHIDVIGVGPDTFDEMEFYAGLFHYIATYD